MSSVLYGLETPPPAFSLLQEWAFLGGDEFSLYHRLLSGARRGEWSAFWQELDPGIAHDLEPVDALEAVVRTHGLPVMRRHLSLVGLRDWSDGGLPAYGLSSPQYVALGLSSAIVGELLAERTGQDPARGFLVGLFGAIGLVPVAKLLRRVRPNVRFPGDVTALAVRIRWEREQIHYDSLTVGGALLDRWGFAASISAAVRGLAYPLLVANGRPLTMLAHLSARMAPVVVFGDARAALDRVSRKCFETFGLPPSIIAELAGEANTRLSQIVELRWPEAVVAKSRSSKGGTMRDSAIGY